jgi:hypothetical protein
MAYADFDRDGDVDVVFNNTNMPATVLQNMMNDNSKDQGNFLNVRMKGDAANINGIGAVVRLYYQRKQQIYDCTPYRGYLSSVENIAHFGLGNVTAIDSVVVQWPTGLRFVTRNVAANQTINADIGSASPMQDHGSMHVDSLNLFTDVTKRSGINFTYSEEDFVDFNIQHLLPHQAHAVWPFLSGRRFGWRWAR